MALLEQPECQCRQTGALFHQWVIGVCWWIWDTGWWLLAGGYRMQKRDCLMYGIHTGWDTGCIYEIVRHNEHWAPPPLLLLTVPPSTLEDHFRPQTNQRANILLQKLWHRDNNGGWWRWVGEAAKDKLAVCFPNACKGEDHGRLR